MSTLDKLNFYYREALDKANDFALYFNKQEWVQHDYFNIKFNSLLGVHGGDYFSPLKPGFLYQIDNLKTLDSFKYMMARDGLAGLSYFFSENQKPVSDSLILGIPYELSFLIPDQWVKQCVFYQIQSKHQKPNDPQNLFLEGLCLGQSIDLDSLKEKLISAGKFEKVYVSLGHSTNFKEQRLCHQDTLNFVSLISLFTELYGNDFDFVTSDRLFDFNLSSCLYLDINHAPLWYYDSYVRYNMVEAGAYPLQMKSPLFEAKAVYDHGFFQEIRLTDTLETEMEEYRIAFQNESSLFKEKNKQRNHHLLERIEMISPALESQLLYWYYKIHG